MSARQSAVKKYVVAVSAEEPEHLQTVLRSGKHPARKLLRARIFLKAEASDAGDAWTKEQIACGLGTSFAPVARVRQQLVEKGRARWTLRMLEGTVVELYIVARASDSTIGGRSKNLLKPHLNEQWVIPDGANPPPNTPICDLNRLTHDDLRRQNRAKVSESPRQQIGNPPESQRLRQLV